MQIFTKHNPPYASP